MRVLALVGVVVLAGACKQSTPDAPVDAGAPAKAEAPKPPAPPPVVNALPSAPSTLSVFEPVDASCEWRALEPDSGKTTVLAKVPGSCVGARVSWSADAAKALVWFDPQHLQSAGYASQTSSKPGYEDEVRDEQAKPRLFLVDVRAGKAEALPMPAAGASQTLDEVGLAADGAPLAFFEEALSDEVQEKGSVTVDGQVFDLTAFEEGLPALAHAQKFAGGKWTRVETKATTTGWDYAMGVQALDAFGGMGPRSVELSSGHAQGDVAEPKEAAALKKLAPKKAGPEDGEWIFIGAGGARVYAWEISGEFAYTTGLVATGTPPQVLAKLGFTDGDLVSLRTSGKYLLVTAANVGTHPRLYALPEGKLVFSSDTARAVTFWPTTAKPESHEAK